MYCLVLCVQEGFLQSCLAPGLKPFCLILFMEICLYWMCVQPPPHPALKFYLTTFLGGRRELSPTSCPLDCTCATYVAYVPMNRNIHILHTKLTMNAVWFFETWFLGSLDCPSTSSLFVDQLASHSQRSAYKCSF